jgi:hypothetical protein
MSDLQSTRRERPDPTDNKRSNIFRGRKIEGGGTVKRNDLKGYGKIPLSNGRTEAGHHERTVNLKEY